MLSSSAATPAPDAPDAAMPAPQGVDPAASMPAPAMPLDRADPLDHLDHLDHYVISADADPGLMPRVLQLIAKRGLVPAECHAFTRRGNEPGRPARLTMEVKVAGLERSAAGHVAACLRNLFGVDSVLHLADRPGAG
jgi:hypothetical protein